MSGVAAKGLWGMMSRAKIERWLRRMAKPVPGEQDIERLVAAGLQFGEGARVMHGAYIDPERPWLISMGAQSGLSPGASVLTHDDSLKIQTGFTRIAPVEIGERVFVGAGATILPGTRIGDDSLIAAGAVVSGEIPAGSMVAGHPGEVVATVKRAEAWHRQTVLQGPLWPKEGWTKGMGITAERMTAQREALAEKREGYVKKPRPWARQRA